MKRDLERVVVVGTSGCGKTTFARRLATILDTTPVELDALYWGAGWTPVPAAEFVRRVAAAAARARWVIDGNYAAARELIWPHATSVIWLNYGFPTVFWRVLLRTLRRTIRREPLFSGNMESFATAFFSTDSMLVWVMTTFRRRRAGYAKLRDAATYPALQWLEFRRPAQAEAFLRQLDETS